MKKLIKKILILLYTIRDNTRLISEQNKELIELSKLSNVCQKEYLTKREAAAYMGQTISYIESLIKTKSIASYTPSPNAKYVRRADIDNFIASNKTLSIEEIKAKAAMMASKRK